MSRPFFFVTALLGLLFFAGCARYRGQYASVDWSAAQIDRQAPEGPLDFRSAMRLLVLRHPELCATRAEIAAVNLNPGGKTLFGQTQIMDGKVTETMLGTDVLSLFGIGPRASERVLARAIQDERFTRHYERARELVADLAESFAVEQVLRALDAPSADIDIEAFASAGLAPKSVIAAAGSVRAEAQAEARVIAAALRDARRGIAHGIATAPDVELTITPVGPDWPQLEEPERQRLVLSRGDLQRLLAAWRVADKRYRLAIARQYPNLVLGLGANVDMQVPMQLIRLELPLDAPAAAAAAGHARDAAFHRLDAGVLAALHEAEAARLELEARNARLDAVRERLNAARTLLEAERAHLETEPAGLARAVLVAGREIDAARQYREAAVAAARARVRAARVAGWPSARAVGGVR